LINICLPLLAAKPSNPGSEGKGSNMGTAIAHVRPSKRLMAREKGVAASFVQ